MKLKHRLITGVLIGILVLQVSACTSSNNSNTPPAAAPAAGTSAPTNSIATPAASTAAPTPAGKIPNTYPLVTSPATVSVFTNNDDGVDLSKNWFTKYYEDLTGVTIDWRVTNSDQYLEKLSLMLAGGDVIDIITSKNKTIPKVTVLRYGQQGVILPINQFFDTIESNYEKNILNNLDTYPLWRKSVTAPDGNIYGFNDVGSCFHCSNSYKMFVNQVWLDNLKIDVPTTTEEFYNMLVRFKNEDANGNGIINDEIPLTTCTISTGASSNLEVFLMNAFQYSDYVSATGPIPYIENGKARVSYNTEDWREGLRYLNKLAVEGLLDPDAFTQDRTTVRNRNDSGDVSVYGAVPGGNSGVFTTYAASERWKEYTIIPPLTGPKGLRTTTNGSLRNYDNFRTMISATSKNPELAFRFCDSLWSSEEIGLLSGEGEQGVWWDWAKEGQIGKDGQPARYDKIKFGELPEKDPFYRNYRWGATFATFPTNHSKWTAAQTIDSPKDAYFERYLYLGTVPYNEVQRPTELTMPSFFYNEEDNAEIARLITALKAYVDESTAGFVMGIKSLDKDWDAYIKELDNIGLPRYLEIMQKYYDAYTANK